MIAGDFSDWIKDYNLTAQHAVYNKDVKSKGLSVLNEAGIIKTATGLSDIDVSNAFYVENTKAGRETVDRSEAAQIMINILNEGGKIHARVSSTNNGGHSVKIDGYQIDSNGKLFFEVKDPGRGKYNLYDPEKRRLCFKDKNTIEPVYDKKRSLIRFQTAKVKKNK